MEPVAADIDHALQRSVPVSGNHHGGPAKAGNDMVASMWKFLQGTDALPGICKGTPQFRFQRGGDHVIAAIKGVAEGCAVRGRFDLDFVRGRHARSPSVGRQRWGPDHLRRLILNTVSAGWPNLPPEPGPPGGNIVQRREGGLVYSALANCCGVSTGADSCCNRTVDKGI